MSGAFWRIVPESRRVEVCDATGRVRIVVGTSHCADCTSFALCADHTARIERLRAQLGRKDLGL